MCGGRNGLGLGEEAGWEVVGVNQGEGSGG